MNSSLAPTETTSKDEAQRHGLMLELAKARKELQEKTLLDIERATAITWGSRAAACMDLAHEAETRQERNLRLREAENYRQEAIEHAAMTEDIQFLQDILAAIDSHKTKQEQGHAPPAGKAAHGAAQAGAGDEGQESASGLRAMAGRARGNRPVTRRLRRSTAGASPAGRR